MEDNMTEINFELKVGGVHIPLRRFDNLRFVTPARDFHPMRVAARLATSTRLAIEPNYPQETLVVWGEQSKLKEIRSYPDIANTRSAFLDPNGQVLVLTNDILVRFRAGSSDADRERLLAQFDGRVLTRKGDLWIFRVNDVDEDAPLLWSDQLGTEGIVEYAEPNALQSATFHQLEADNEPRFPNQWHLRNTGQGGGTSGADVDALGAWVLTIGAPNIAIVVHDTGVDINHPDLAANVEEGWDYDNDDDDATNNNNAHGTACAGVIAASINGQGVTGIAPGCRIVPLRAAGSHTWQTWADTIEWAAKRGRIVSCSWTITPNNTLSQAIKDAVDEGVTFFFATGNGHPSPVGFPASLADTVGVGASTNQDVRAAYSQTGNGIDLVAPSSGGTLRIETTDVRGTNGYNTAASPNGDYCESSNASGFGGTSSATPLVAGVAGLMLSVNPALSPADIRTILRETADQIDQANGNYDGDGWSTQYGFGRVNASAAVTRAHDLANPKLPLPLQQGIYTVQQKSNSRFVDAHESGNDFSVVTRTAQLNDSQKWSFTPLGGLYTIQQKSSDRYLDAHEDSNHDFSMVTRTAQNNTTQRWFVLFLGNDTYTIQQQSNGRFADAHENASNDYSAVTRTAQNNDTQRWILTPLGNDTYTIQQRSNGRFLDAHEAGNDYSVVTRGDQNNDSQRWILKPLSGVYCIQQQSNGRFFDAHENSSKDYSVVTRGPQNNDTQRWLVTDLGSDAYTIQQKSNNRYMDAHESGNDYSVVTRPAQNNDSQRWLIKSFCPQCMTVPITLAQGVYAIQQRSNNRFVDAHEDNSKDYSVVTRSAQNNDSQRWELTPIGSVCTIQQKSNLRYLDAHENSEQDYSAVTRTEQGNDTQQWVLMHLGGDTYTIQQRRNGRFLDAHENSANDYSVVSRTAQNNDTQRWILTPLGNGTFTIQQKSSGRYLDAHENVENDFSAVTRGPQNNDTQRWVLKPVGGVYRIQQKVNGRFLDAHEKSSEDYSVVTRTAQSNATQHWVIMKTGSDFYTVQQQSNGRFADAHENSANDYSVVTRTAQNNDTQRWKFTPLGVVYFPSTVNS
jgi:subtilisin family serine protease